MPRLVEYDVGHVDIVHIKLSKVANGTEPLFSLCEQLIEQVPLLEETGVDADTLVEQISKSPKSLFRTFKQLSTLISKKHSLHENINIRIQLVLDQGEEIFTTKAFTRSQQSNFFEGLQAIIDTGFIWCLGTIRSDFVGQGQYTQLYELMRGDGDYKLQPPLQNELRQII
jgi:hypothetical protein